MRKEVIDKAWERYGDYLSGDEAAMEDLAEFLYPFAREVLAPVIYRRWLDDAVSEAVIDAVGVLQRGIIRGTLVGGFITYLRKCIKNRAIRAVMDMLKQMPEQGEARDIYMAQAVLPDDPANIVQGKEDVYLARRRVIMAARELDLTEDEKQAYMQVAEEYFDSSTIPYWLEVTFAEGVFRRAVYWFRKMLREHGEELGVNEDTSEAIGA